MRVIGYKGLPSVGARRRLVVALFCAAALLALDLSTGGTGRSWTSTVGETVIAPANARDRNRRLAPDKAAEDAKRAEDAQRRQQVLQQSQAVQKRLQNIQQNMAVAQQKRVQVLQQVQAAAQKQIQQAQQQTNALVNTMRLRMQQMRANQQPSPGTAPNSVRAPQQPFAVLKRVQESRANRHNNQQGPNTAPNAAHAPQPFAILKRVQEMRASHHGVASRNVRVAPNLPPAMRRHVVMQNVMARLRHQRAGQFAPGRSMVLRPGVVGHHHSALLAAMARGRNPFRHVQQGHSRFFYGQPRQNAIYHRLLEKLAHHRRSRQAPATVTTAKVTTPATTPVKATTSGVALQGLGSDPSVSSTVANSKLPEVAALDTSKATDNKTTDWSLSKLGGPQQPQAEEEEGGSAKGGDPKIPESAIGSVKGKKKGDNPGNTDSAPKSLKQSVRGARVDLRQILPPHTFVPNRVLAINLSKAGRKKVEALKFKVIEDVNLSALDITVTLLQPSAEFNAVSGLGNLYKAAPEEDFSLDRVYATYRTTAETSPSGAGTNAPAPSKLPPGNNGHRWTGCPADRCFAPTLISWQPQLGACARDVKIGVIDTAYDESHPAFVGAHIVRDDKDILPNGSSKASNVHGTAVLSLLTGNSGSATPGLVPQAKFFFQDAFYADHNGNAMSSTATMLKALNWMMEMHVDILNLSFAGPEDHLVHASIVELAKKGTVVLAAAGNEGPQAPPSYPAAYPEVIAVTAVDRNLAAYTYANRGKHIAVAAPGVDVWAAAPGGRAGAQTGTSFAVPFATSVVALSYPPAESGIAGDPLAPRRRALELLQKSIRPISGNRQVFGAGLVQAPSHCDPHRSPAIAAVGWGKVEVARPASGANQWVTETVHSVANKK
jgi:Subtilase family